MLKTIMRIYCFETEKDWDEGIHLLLFAARESVQKSLGFSPFDLVFGHTVRGPLKLLKESLLSSSSESINLLQYVSDFHTKLFRACELARANLSSSQSMKRKHDVDAVECNFQPGQKVLALFPVLGNLLNSRFFGPYVIQKKLTVLNYKEVTPDRRKQTQLCHVNTLKPYVQRSRNPVLQPVNVNVVLSEPKEDLGSEPSSNSFGPTDMTRLGTWIPSCLTYHRVNARTWRSFCWCLSTCFLMFPQGQIRFIMTLMLAMLIQLSSTLTD